MKRRLICLVMLAAMLVNVMIPTAAAAGSKSGESSGFGVSISPISSPKTRTQNDDSDFFSSPVYNAEDFEDYVNATVALIQQYEDVDSGIGDEYSTGRLIVKSGMELDMLMDYNPSQVIVDAENNYLIQFDNPGSARECAEALKKVDYVKYAEPDRVVGIFPPIQSDSIALATSAGAKYNSWGVEATKAGEYAKKLTGLSSQITVAVVDTGVDKSHSFLAGRVLDGYDLVDGDSNPMDGHGHGTHVSGTVVDCTPGLNIKILPVRVLDNNGSGYDSVVGQGIRYAVDHGANVINMSLGGYGHSDSIGDQIAYAISKNVTVCVAAGNETDDTKYYCPAHNEDCITVAAVDIQKEQAYFSNFGDAVDIAAPGVDIKSCLPGEKYASWDGTSMATPHVAAAAAMILYANNQLTPKEVEKKLRDAAVDLGPSGWDKDYGAGFLSLEAFLSDTPIIDPPPIDEPDDPGRDTPPHTPNDDIFTDVPKGSYFYDAVYWAVEQGITTGTSSTTFSPHNTCTTAHILTFLWRADGSPEPDTDSVSSVSSSSGHYYDKAMDWAYSTGIAQPQMGIDSAVSPAAVPCIRADAMTYMWRHANSPASGKNPFTDVPNHTYYAQAVSWAVNVGITKGTTDSTFSPQNSCTRAQIVTFLYRYFNGNNA